MRLLMSAPREAPGDRTCASEHDSDPNPSCGRGHVRTRDREAHAGEHVERCDGYGQRNPPSA